MFGPFKLAVLGAAAAVLYEALVPVMVPDVEGNAASKGSLQVAIDTGKQDSRVVLLFVHGWPDNAKVWKKQLDHFAGLGYRCVAAELPNSGSSGEQVRAGYDFEVVASQLMNLAASLRGDERSLVLIGHDWGAWIGYMAQRKAPHLFDAMVPMDVAPGYGPVGFDVAWRVGFYQFVAMTCFNIGRLPYLQEPADYILRAFVRGFLGPLSRWGEAGEQLSPTPFEEMTAAMGWPYWHTLKPPKFFYRAQWRTQGLQGWCNCADDAKLEGEIPSCPTLLLYGDAPSALPLTGRYFVEALAAKGGPLRYAKAFNSHHWFFYWRSEEVNQAIEGFLAKAELTA
mmetsp:Transcript_49445/g.111046  ORF Transcript_49445/g.111046 Transcript_49445/m.111046 type:complete len:339 (+) Transcript_49445:36-1052(+)